MTASCFEVICPCGRTVQSTSREFQCPSCGRKLVVEWASEIVLVEAITADIYVKKREEFAEDQLVGTANKEVAAR